MNFPMTSSIIWSNFMKNDLLFKRYSQNIFLPHMILDMTSLILKMMEWFKKYRKLNKPRIWTFHEIKKLKLCIKDFIFKIYLFSKSNFKINSLLTSLYWLSNVFRCSYLEIIYQYKITKTKILFNYFYVRKLT